jgi:citrate lyase subunit beta/citryl-CoA lyase
VELANEIFTPPASEVDKAKRILAALKEAAAQGKGAAALDGRLIDAASEKMANNVVRAAEAIAAKTQ